MANSKELEKIKKLYGERFMKLCRELFPMILEKEGLLLEILTSSFGSNCKNLYEDIKNAEIEGNFKNFIYNKIDVEKGMNIIRNKTPYELLDEAGYTLYECKSEEEIQAFRKYYAENEALCTFCGGRLNKCVVFFAVKKDVENIKRENFTDPRREDEYGTSVLGIQFDKRGQCTVSIKNRYNHTVNNPDATYGNDLDKIILGLKNSFKELLAERNLDFTISNMEELEIPGYVVADDGRYYKYNMEKDGIYYCPGNIVIDFGKVVKIENPERQLLINNFILDMENKVIKLQDENAYIHDSFLDGFQGIEKIDIKKDNKNKDGIRIITMQIKEQDNPVIIKIDKYNNIIYYENENLREIGNNFLRGSSSLKELNLPNLREVGHNFLRENKELEELDLPSLEIAGCDFLSNNSLLKRLNTPSLREVGENFLKENNGLEELDLPSLEITGKWFLYWNSLLNSLNVPSLKEAKSIFLSNNKRLKELDLPSLEIAGGDFLSKNSLLKRLNAPRLRKAGYNFLEKNNELEELDLPSLEIAEDNFLRDNILLKRLNTPNLREVERDFFGQNNGIEELDLPSLEIAGSGFLWKNSLLKRLNAPNLREVGWNFLSQNNGLEELDLSSLEIVERYFLSNNSLLKRLNAPKLKKVGQNCLSGNTNVEVIYDEETGKPKIIYKENLINNKDIAELDKQNNITTSEISEVGTQLKEVLQGKDKEKNDMEK